jgi:hypothetical protein
VKDERSNRKTNERGYVKDLGVDGKAILKLLKVIRCEFMKRIHLVEDPDQ